MTGPSRLPAGWHATTPRQRAVTTERVVADDAPDPASPANRAQRRAAARALRRSSR